MIASSALISRSLRNHKINLQSEIGSVQSEIGIVKQKRRELLGLYSAIVSPFSLGPVEMPPKKTTFKTAVNDDAPLNQTSEPTPLNQTSEPMMAISSRQDYLALAAAYIHQEDDVEQAHDWIEKGGRVNASRLAKKLPHTARGLADGSTDPDALANSLINGLVERTVVQSLINADGTVRLARGGGTIVLVGITRNARIFWIF
jgi:hypothetical protein